MGESATNLLEAAVDADNRHPGPNDVDYSRLREYVAELKARLAKTEHNMCRRNLEAKQLSNRLMRLFEILPGAILVIDGAGIIRECNIRSKEMLNCPLLGCAWSVIVKREFCRGASRDGELKLKNGRWLSLARRELGTEPGEILLLVDITESRRTADLSQRSERLSQLGEMSAHLGHQIRTPLATALLYGSKMCTVDSSELTESAQIIVQRLREIGCMVDDMLQFAAGTKQSGDIVLVAEMLQEVADDHAVLLPSGSELKVEVVERHLSVTGNRDALKGALSNLIINAMQANLNAPVIQLGAVKSNGRICITVTDNGPGVSADIRQRLFEPFFTTRPQGTGLGLAVVRSVAEAHAGEVMLDCGQQGTAFSICLPMATEVPRCE